MSRAFSLGAAVWLAMMAAPAVASEARVGGSRLDDATVRREIPAQYKRPAGMSQRFVGGKYHLIVKDLAVRNILTEAL